MEIKRPAFDAKGKRDADIEGIIRPPARHLRAVGGLAGESSDDDGDGRHGAEHGVDGGCAGDGALSA